MGRSKVKYFQPAYLRARRRRCFKAVSLTILLIAVCIVPIGAMEGETEIRFKPAQGDRKLVGGTAWNRVSKLVGRVTHVRDGDTIELQGTPVRLTNLDCDEAGTIAGNRATRRMRQLVASKILLCRLNGKQSYDREIGSCSLQDGREIGSVMISEGFCARRR